jgi:ribosomal protein L13
VVDAERPESWAVFATNPAMSLRVNISLVYTPPHVTTANYVIVINAEKQLYRQQVGRKLPTVAIPHRAM